MALKVGELAKQTGLTVRTLHYYDEIGLLSPSYRTEVGYRLYVTGDIARLQQIISLRQLGFSLEEIQNCLNRPDFSPQRVIQLHLARLREQIAIQQWLCQRLEAIAAHICAAEEVSAAEFMRTIKEINMAEKYYTPEQLEAIKQRGQLLGEERIHQVEAEWPELIAQVRAAMDQGADPASEPVQQLARRWMSLVQEFTGGDPGIERSLRTMYQQEPTIAGMETAPMREMFEYISKALAAPKS